jgi:hypothetical protein
LASLLCATVAMPAIAQGYRDGHGYRDNNRHDRFDRIGTVEFSRPFDHERQYGTFGGPIEAIRLEARDSNVYCRNVRVAFANGRFRNVFEGRLREDRPVTVDLPGGERNVRHIDFNCRALSPRGSRVDISADIGGYRNAWMQNPNFDRYWGGRFPWADRRRTNWVPLGAERFEGPRDREAAILGRRGEQIESIALRPLNADARCRRVTATFRNGRTRDLDIGPGDFLAEQQIYRIDLPGNERNVERIELSCRAIREPGVTVQVLALR